MSAGAFFVRDGDEYVPTEHVASPWNPEQQAGGAPAALLAQLIEEHARADLRPGRAQVDILGPVAARPGRIELETVRQGRATEFVVGRWLTDGVESLRVSMWRVAPAPTVPEPGPASVEDRVPGPDELGDHRPPPALFSPTGFVAALQWRLVRGGFDVPGPGVAWCRPRLPLLAGARTPSIAALLLVGATANGLSSTLDLRRYLAVDVDITVVLERDLVDGWVLLDSLTRVASGEVGHVSTTFADRAGPVGRGLQTLLVAPRRSRSAPPVEVRR